MLPALVIAASLAGPAVDLRWDAPAGCPSQADIAGQIAARVGDSADAPARVVFHVEPRDGRWHLVGEISGVADGGRRELSAATCEELAEAAVLIVTIAVDPPVVPPAPQPAAIVTPPPDPPAAIVTLPPAPPAAIVTPPPAPPASPPLVERAPSPSPPPPRRRLSALIGLAGGLGLGALPGPAGLLRLALGVRGERWSAALVQDLWLPRSRDVSTDPAYGGRFSLWSAGLRGCGVVPAGRVEVPLCATLAAGVMAGKGVGALAVARSQVSPWLAAAAGPGLRVPLGRGAFGLLFAAELVAVLARPRFEISGEGVVCCEDRVGGQFTGGLELRLP